MCAELLQVYVENYGMTGASEYFDNQTNARIFLSSVFERIHDTDMNVKAATQNLITALSGVASKAMLGAFQNSSSSKVLKSMSALMSVPHSGAFRAQHFQIWFAHLGMEHLIQGSSRDDYNDTAEDYLIRLYHSCQSDCLLYSHGNPPPGWWNKKGVGERKY